MEKGYLSEAFVSFQGEGQCVGRRQLFLRFAGCPLRCRYCDTPESLVRTNHFAVHIDESVMLPNPVSLGDVRRAIELLDVEMGLVDGVALTGGEPLAQVDFLETLLLSGALPRPRLLETAGVLTDELSRVLPYIDVVSMDLKLPSNTGETAFWEEHGEFLKLAANKAYVKILVDEQTLEDDMYRATSIVQAAGLQIPVFLQPITDRRNRTSIGPKRLATLFGIARTVLQDVRVLPQTHKMLQVL